MVATGDSDNGSGRRRLAKGFHLPPKNGGSGMTTTDLARSHRVGLDGWLTIPEPLVVEAAGRAGFDWIGPDFQHGAWDLGRAFCAIQLPHALDVPVLVRLSEEELAQIPRVLDHSASGVVVAMLSSPEIAAAALARAQYRPERRRGYGGQRFGLRREATNVAEIRQRYTPSSSIGADSTRRGRSPQYRASPACMSVRSISASGPTGRSRPLPIHYAPSWPSAARPVCRSLCTPFRVSAPRRSSIWASTIWYCRLTPGSCGRPSRAESQALAQKSTYRRDSWTLS